jgi:hypothetical protein
MNTRTIRDGFSAVSFLLQIGVFFISKGNRAYTFRRGESENYVKSQEKSIKPLDISGKWVTIVLALREQEC